MSAVTDHLGKLGVGFEVIPHEQTSTSIDEAQALGIDADEVAKTLLVETSSGRALVVIPGSRRLDTHRMQEALGDRRARLATEDELLRDLPDVELGALPPLGSLLSAPTFIDPLVMTHETIVFAAGTTKESVRIRTQDLFRDEEVTVAPLTKAG